MSEGKCGGGGGGGKTAEAGDEGKSAGSGGGTTCMPSLINMSTERQRVDQLVEWFNDNFQAKVADFLSRNRAVLAPRPGGEYSLEQTEVYNEYMSLFDAQVQ